MSELPNRQSLSPDETLVSVVLPAYNEAAVLPRLLQLVEQALQSTGCQYEILFINDGSTDGSAEILDGLADENRSVRVLHFSRNFGHQAAVQAGLAHAHGDAVVIMDSDLQDAPTAIGDFLAKWREGFDVVYAVRSGRKEGPIKRLLFHSFYRVLNSVASIRMPPDAGNFGLIDGRVARQVAELPEQDRYFAGLRTWVGYRQIGVTVERAARHDDKPRVSLRGLFRLAKDAIFSFSTLPLSTFYFIAAASMVVCVGLIGYALYFKLFTDQTVPGWTSITITASFFGAINALGIAILGEYVIRIYNQVRNRPMYIVARTRNFTHDNRAAIHENPPEFAEREG